MTYSPALITLRLRVCLLMSGLLVILAGCQSRQSMPPQAEVSTAIASPSPIQPAQATPQLVSLLYQQHQLWQGTPYRLGGNSRRGIDCSAFVQVTYREILEIDLPRTTRDQVNSGQRISRAALQAGDLIFFRKGNHVGIYLEKHKFLHASTTRGVIISDLKNSYWTRHYWQAIRVPD